MTPKATYQNRVREFSARLAERKGRETRIVHLRMGTFLAAVACFFLGAFEVVPQAALAGVGGAAFISFVVLVLKHPRVLRQVKDLEELVAINEEAEARLARRWDDVPLAEIAPAPEHHLYAEDLDVLGRASLFHLLGGSAPTALGARELRSWLLHPPEASSIPTRQTAVAELATAIDFRDEFTALGRLLGDIQLPRLERFIDWAGSPGKSVRQGLLRAVAWLVPIATITFIALHLLGIIPWLWVISVMAAVLISVATHRATGDTIRQASLQSDRGIRFSELMGLIHRQRFDDPLLKDRQSGLTADDGSPACAMLVKLEKLVVLADAKNSHFLYIIAQTLTLWDIHVFLGLERWKTLTGRHVQDWFESLAALEGLAALGTLAHAHPGWTFPLPLQDDSVRIIGQGVGHPLLPPHVCVTNDVELGPPTTLLIVSGSNMSGKSTLLRALGANVVLARIGSKVCASSLQIPLDMHVVASGRIHDSLSAGVSFFLAEVRRLVAILEAVEDAGNNDCATLCILDELLQGTNAAERKIGVLRVLRRLLGLNAITAFATHDLSFRDDPDVAGACTHVHFEELVDPDSPTLICDYLLRPGVLTSGNAVHVMDVNGLTSPRITQHPQDGSR